MINEVNKEKFVLEKIFSVTTIDEYGEVIHIYDSPTNIGLPVSEENEVKSDD